MSTKAIRDVSTFLKTIVSSGMPMMFRGQSKEWSLIPSLGRVGRLIDDYEDWKTLQHDLVQRFAKYARQLLDADPRTYEEWLVHAQHHGVPTRLLDWTTNPLKALFWAVEDRHYETANGVVWAFSPAFWQEDYLEPVALLDDALTPFLPPQVNARVLAQDACFVAFPTPEHTSPLPPLNSPGAYPKSISRLDAFVIPSSAKRVLRIELRTLGITHRSLFPDLDGVARDINAEISGA